MQQQPTSQQAANSGFPIDQEALTNLMAISGSSRESCTQALQAAFGDPNRAYEFLILGMGVGCGMGGVQPGMMGDEMMDEYGDEGEEDS